MRGLPFDIALELIIVAENPLASGFDILLGRFEITVPDVADGDDYAIVRE